MPLTQQLAQIHKTIGSRLFSAIWFALVALINILPALLLSSINLEVISSNFGVERKLIVFELLIPVVMAMASGAIYGSAILNNDIKISDYQAFIVAVRISIIAAAMTLISHIIIAAFFDLPIAPVLGALFLGAPFYGVIAGLSGFGLRAIGRAQT